MNSSIILNEADELRLEMLVKCQMPFPLPDARQQQLLNTLLDSPDSKMDAPGRGVRAGFYDRITLVSPVDSRDSFRFSIVMPHEADVDNDLISVLMPISMAVMGRGCGQLVSWETPTGIREMRIIAVEQAPGCSLVADDGNFPRLSVVA